MIYDFDAELRSIGAIKDGHFLLASGRHSGQYVEKFDLLRNPTATQTACQELIRRLGTLAKVDLVVGPTTGGILLAFEIARQLDLPAAYAEREQDGSSVRLFKRGTTIDPETTVLIVDDILTTGGSIFSTISAVAAWQAKPVAVALLADRSGGSFDPDIPVLALSTLDIETWPADECPLCASGVDLTKPGSGGSIT